MSQSRTYRHSDLTLCGPHTALLTTTGLVVVDLLFSCCWLTWFFNIWLILLACLLVIHWSSSQSSVTIYRAAGNPLILSILGPKSTDPVWPLCLRPTVTTWNPMSWRYPAEPSVACGTQARRPPAEMWHFFSWSKVHGRVQSPVRSVISFCTRQPHSAIEVSTPSLSLYCSPNSLFPTSRSANSFSTTSLSPNSPIRNAVTKLIRRVSGSRQATMRCNLWGVI